MAKFLGPPCNFADGDFADGDFAAHLGWHQELGSRRYRNRTAHWGHRGIAFQLVRS